MRAGAPRPDISSVDAFKRALLNARSIAYLRVGSGIYLAGLLDRLGIAEAIKSKVMRPESDIVSELVAKGEIEIAMTVITQILTTPGVDLVGPLPPEIQSYITFTAGVSSRTMVPDAARQLIQFLREPRAIAVIKAQGMEPAGQLLRSGRRNDSGESVYNQQVKRSGVADLPLHGGRVPAWLATAWSRSAPPSPRACSTTTAAPRCSSRLSDPFWFQALGLGDGDGLALLRASPRR